MTNFKRKKPRRYSKVFRGGTDGPDCGWCGSNWTYEKFEKEHLVEWELEDDGAPETLYNEQLNLLTERF